MVQFTWKHHPEELHLQELHHIVECAPFLLLSSGSHVPVAIVRDFGSIFVPVAGVAFLDDHHHVGDPVEKITGVFTQLHSEVGEALNNELVVGLNGLPFLEPGFQIRPGQLIIRVVQVVYHGKEPFSGHASEHIGKVVVCDCVTPGDSRGEVIHQVNEIKGQN